MEIKVVKFTLKYLEDVAGSFIISFPDWNMKEAKAYLLQAYRKSPGFCLAAVNDKVALGAIFARKCPYNKGNLLLIESLQVLKKYRKNGIGTLLFKKLIALAKAEKIKNVGMLVPRKNKFPLEWYKTMGFKETGWIELAADLKDIRIVDV